MHNLHKEILEQLRKNTQKQKTSKLPSTYSGSRHPSLFVSTWTSRTIAKEWVRQHREITSKKFIAFLDSLYSGETIDEKKMGGKILGYAPHLRATVSPTCLDKWLEQLEGWEEIDSLCQSNFTEKDLLGNWHVWQAVLAAFCASKHISKRRASLVLLTGPIGKSNDKRIVTQAFAMIDALKGEKHIPITKAISWLLRSMIRLHRKRVEEYVEKNKETLPPLAIRETIRKLQTGRK